MNYALKILIVDDEENLRETLADIMHLEGYVTTMAEDGVRAVEAVKKERFDIILMDFKMSGMNGVEAFRNIKKIQGDARVLFVTAYYNEKLVKEAIQECAMGVCHKPLDIEKLLNDIRVVSSGKKCRLH